MYENQVSQFPIYLFLQVQEQKIKGLTFDTHAYFQFYTEKLHVVTCN